MEDDKKMTLRVPPGIYEKMTAEAKAQNRSIHNLILTILLDYFTRKA